MGGEALRTGNVASLRDALISLVSSPHTALRLCGVTENSASSRLFRHNVDNHPSPKSGGRRITGRGGAQRNPCDASTIRHRTPKGWQEHINRHPAAPTGLCVLLCRHLQEFRPAASTPACIPTSPPGTCACPCPCPRPAPQAGREGAGMETKKGRPFSGHPSKRLAATYFSTNKCSIIGDGGLNFSVRNGKR